MNRYLITPALIALAILALALTRPFAADAPPTDLPPCTLIAPDADHSFGVITNAEWEGDGVWRDMTGAPIGYAAHEDAIIYSTPEDARHCAPYLD